MNAKSGKMLVSALLVLTLLLSTVPVLSLLPASAQTTEILLDPTPVEVVSGDPFTVTLKINNIPDPPGLAAYDFRITFNPSVIQFGANAGDHDWTDPDFGTPFAFNVDNAAGSIGLADILMSGPYPSGDITLVVLHGTTIAAECASTALHFDKADIMDPDGEPIPATVTDGEVVVWVAPVASFTWGYTDSNGSGTLDAGEQIQFTDTSTCPTSWDWDFDDGDTSTIQNPTHSYNTAGTYHVCLDVANLAGSDSACEDILVEPACLDLVTVSPNPETVMVNGVVTFAAAGYDEFGNPIPGIAWSWEVTNPTAGTIDPMTGEFTAGSTTGTYPDVIKATGTYKECEVSGYATVEVISVLADIGMSKGLDDVDEVVLVKATIIKTYDPSDPVPPMPVPGGIASYVAEANYNGSRINILDVRGCDYPFDDPPTSILIDNVAGSTTFSAVQTKAETQAPICVAQMVVRLVGCADEEARLDLSFTEIADGDGNLIPQDEPDYEVFRRGNAKADDDVVNISDALFIAQYLVGSRDLGQETGLVHPVNAASPKHDDGGDKISIADVLFICQYLVQLRDNCFELVPQ